MFGVLLFIGPTVQGTVQVLATHPARTPHNHQRILDALPHSHDITGAPNRPWPTCESCAEHNADTPHVHLVRVLTVEGQHLRIAFYKEWLCPACGLRIHHYPNSPSLHKPQMSSHQALTALTQLPQHCAARWGSQSVLPRTMHQPLG